MRRPPRIILALLALALFVNGPVAAIAGSASGITNAMHEVPGDAAGDSAPCHERQGPEQSDCCEHGGCLCILGTAGIAAIDATIDRQLAPQHSPSVSALSAGHPHLGPARLLRPPIV